MVTSTIELLAWARTKGPDIERDLAQAINFAQQAHRGRFRLSGDPYLTHPIEVAHILAHQGEDPTTVIVAVLHGMANDPNLESITNLRNTFGDAITDLLVEFAALDRSAELPRRETTDRRALAIAVASQLHNMRTIRHCTPEAQQRKAAQTSDVVAPLARQLGLYAIGDELDALAASTLRAHGASPTLAAPAARHDRMPTGTRALASTLRLAAYLLPPNARARWIQEWDGELHAAVDLPERCRFVVDVLIGLPTLAILIRRTGSR